MAYGLTQSLELNAASSEYATAADSATLSVTGNLTIEGWVYLLSAPGSGTQYTFGAKYTGAGNQRGYSFWYFNNAGTPQFGLTISSTGANASAATVNHTLSTSTWTHVACVYTASTGGVEFFVNGSSVGTATGLFTSIFDNTALFQLGRENTSFYMDGYMNLWRVWNTTRTGTQINNEKCNVLGSTTNLSAEWTLDNTYNDNSGNSNTLTAVNSPVFVSATPSTCGVTLNTTNFFYMT